MGLVGWLVAEGIGDIRGCVVRNMGLVEVK